jgi:hypothetical protein
LSKEDSYCKRAPEAVANMGILAAAEKVQMAVGKGVFPFHPFLFRHSMVWCYIEVVVRGEMGINHGKGVKPGYSTIYELDIPIHFSKSICTSNIF